MKALTSQLSEPFSNFSSVRLSQIYSLYPGSPLPPPRSHTTTRLIGGGLSDPTEVILHLSMFRPVHLLFVRDFQKFVPSPWCLYWFITVVVIAFFYVL